MRHSLLLLVGVFFLGAAGCTCGDPPFHVLDGGADGSSPGACTADEQCQTAFGPLFACCEGECCQGPRYCDEHGEADCCPGQTCSARAGVCVVAYVACTDDASCQAKGQVCQTKAFGETEQQVCTFPRCGTGGSCGEGQSCFAGFCVGENPCGGSCPAGQACSPANNRCHPSPTCEATCPPGTLAAFADPDNLDEACDLEALTCVCAPLPPLRIKDLGRHSALAVLADGSARVSALEGDHGDLVVVSFAADGALTEITWVDGVPAGAAPVANPAGARGGIAEPGPDVGRWSDIAAAPDGTLHVSYYDVDKGALKYARFSGGAWTHHVIDDAGDVGLYTSLALDPGGVPVIAYFQKAGPDDPQDTALKVARAESPAPADASSWRIVRVDGGTAPTCVENCGLEDLPSGVGLHPSIVADASGVAVAYHDRQQGDLLVALGVDPAAGASGSIHRVAGAGDVGRFPSMARLPGGELAIAYQDVSQDDLAFVTVGADGTVVEAGVADDGLRDPAANGPSAVGADAALALDGTRWLVAYQDATAGDLLYATRTDGAWTRLVRRTEGASGFWADAAYQAGKLYVSQVQLLGARSAPLEASLTLEIIPMP